MSNDIFNSDKQYTESDWESIYPELIELNYKYAEKSKLQSVAILISTVSFEYSTHDGFYVGKNTNEKYDIEEYYFATDDQSRKIQLEQVESSLISDSSKYSKSDFVELYIHLDRDNSIVTEICIKRLDGGYSEKASSIRNRYEHIIDDIISE